MFVAAAGLAVAITPLAVANPPQHAGAAAAHSPSNSPFAPYAFLIGEWNVSPESGGPPGLVLRFKWGPNQSYIWTSASLLANGHEEPHFEGMLVWNGVRKNLDMLLVLDLNSGLAAEQGRVYVEPDGTVVRDITGVFSEGVASIGRTKVGPEGATGRFRQTFKMTRPDTVLTSVMRESAGGWVATFPGSDHLVMTRRTKG
jgi:hypothetical protein